MMIIRVIIIMFDMLCGVAPLSNGHAERGSNLNDSSRLAGANIALGGMHLITIKWMLWMSLWLPFSSRRVDTIWPIVST